MIRNVINYIVILSICLFSTAQGQFVQLKDTVISNFLCKNYPTVMDVTCKNLDTVKAKTDISARLKVNGLGIKDYTELKYLKGINFIKADSNLTGNVNLNFTDFPLVFGLNFSFNNLTTFPDLGPLKTKLKEFYINNNNIEQLIGLDSVTTLEKINIEGNHLRKLPFITKSPNLTTVRIAFNYFNYENLVTIADYPNFKTIFNIYPQKRLTPDLSKVVFLNDTLILSTTIDTSVSNMTYNWYKDNILVKSSSECFLQISNFKIEDAGVYYVELKNSHPNLSSGSLRTGNWTLSTQDCQTIGNVEYDLESNCKNSVLTLKSIELSNTNWKFNFYLENVYTKVKNEILIGNKIELSQMGDFNLIVSDNQNCTQKLDNWISIHPTNCDVVFTPDGDGNNDTYLIEGEGKVKILNKRGQIVNKLTLPIYWDGKDSQGRNLPVGLYGIQFEDGRIDKVTILR